VKKKNILMFAAIVLISCSLRAPITGVGPLVSTISADLGLSAATSGLLTTIPLMAFAVVSLLVGKLSARCGAGYVMLGGVVILCLGLTCRSFLGTAGLFVGTVIVGIGIAVNNVMLPAVIKSRYSDRVGPMTSVYTTAMSLLAMVSTAISVPIALAYNWKTALFIWILVAVLALITWLPSRRITLSGEKPEKKGPSVTKSPTAWWISLFMGFHSLQFYFIVAWFATILQSKGYDKVTAGYINSAYMLLGVFGSFIMPLITSRTKNHSVLGVILGACYTLSVIALLFVQHVWMLPIICILGGAGTGAGLSFAMMLFSLHTKDASDASELSGLAQSIGYFMAAICPYCMGKLFDAVGSWTPPLIILTVLCIAVIGTGWMAGRPRIVNADADPARKT
jgi:CP family cyanate transporter-like MFS transporter